MQVYFAYLYLGSIVFFVYVYLVKFKKKKEEASTKFEQIRADLEGYRA